MPILMAGSKTFDCDALLFDKDGTLLDLKSTWLEWSRFVIEQIIKALQPDVLEPAVLEQAMGIDLAGWQIDPYGALAGGTMHGVRDSLTRVLCTTGVSTSLAKEIITKAYSESTEAMDWGALAQTDPGLAGLLGYLRGRGFKLAVVTADNTMRAETALSALGLTEYFDCITGGDLAEKSKPAPDLALLSTQKLNTQPQRALVIGDSSQDILMAVAAGMYSVGVLSGASLREQLELAGADVVVGSVMDLK